MNRAEAHDYMWYKNEECPSMRWGNHATIRDYVDVMIDEIYDSFEEQIQGLQSLLDLKQKEISVLESNIDSAIAELEDCGWYEATDKQQTMEVLYNIKEKQNL